MPSKHMCDYRCEGESGHHAWPSPAPTPSDPYNGRLPFEAGRSAQVYRATTEEERANEDT